MLHGTAQPDVGKRDSGSVAPELEVQHQIPIYRFATVRLRASADRDGDVVVALAD